MEPIRVRNQAPEITKSPLQFVESSQTKTTESLFSADRRRRDGREDDEIRAVYLERGVVSDCTGSAYLEMGVTKVICSIFGPRELPRSEDFSMEGQVVCDLKYAPFSSRVKHSQDTEKYISSLLAQSLRSAVKRDTFPNLQLVVNVLVLDDGGGVLAASAMCASVALASSGLEMYDVPSACSVSLLSDGRYLYDPVSTEEYHLTTEGSDEVVCGVTAVYLPSLQELALVQQVGTADLQQSAAITERCVEACLRVHQRLRTFLIEDPS